MTDDYRLRLMLDSGAFTVWRQGESIDLDRYIRFILSHERLFSSYVNLDVMPGQPGAVRTPAQTEAAAEAGWANYLQMRESGLEPIHVFHMGERWYWLEKMIDEGCEYVGLSSNITLPVKQKRVWLDECFGLLCGSKGYPEVKVHGFGITAVSLMLRYPWTTTDSVSWMKQGTMGSVYIPRPYGGDEYDQDSPYDYDRAPMAIGISRAGKKGPSSVALGHATHLHNCGKRVRQYVLEYIENEGMRVDELEADYELRIRLNARFFKELTARHQLRPFFQSRSGFFDTTSSRGSTLPPGRFKVVLSVGTYLEYANILREEEYPHQLISYHRISEGPSFDLERFAATGWFVRDSMRGRKDPRLGGRQGGPLNT